jgi:hypothetical protein
MRGVVGQISAEGLAIGTVILEDHAALGGFRGLCHAG